MSPFQKFFLLLILLTNLNQVCFAQAETRLGPALTSETKSVPAWIKPEYRKYQNELLEKNLKTYGFTVENGVLFDVTEGQGRPKKLGLLRVIDVKYAFHWSSAENQKSYLEAHEISEDFMKEIIAQPGQEAGKGFYISFDPIDSDSYGDSITAFKPSGLIVALEYELNIHNLVTEDTDFVQRLSNAGISGLRHHDYKQTWLSAINSKALKKAQNLPKELFLQFLNDPVIRNTFLVYKHPEVYASYVTLKNVNSGIYKAWNNIDFEVDDLIFLNQGKTLPASIMQKYMQTAYKLFQSAETKKEKEKLISLLNFENLSLKVVTNIQQQASKSALNENQLRYKKMLDAFDFAFLSLQKNKPDTVQTLIKNADQYLQLKKNAVQLVTDGGFSSSFDSLKFLQSILGNSVEVRNFNLKESRKMELKLSESLKTNLFLKFSEDGDTTGSYAGFTTYAGLEKMLIFKSAVTGQAKALDLFFASPPFNYDTAEAQNLLGQCLFEFTNFLLVKNNMTFIEAKGSPNLPNALLGYTKNYMGTYDAQDMALALVSLHPFNFNDKLTITPLFEVQQRSRGVVQIVELNAPFMQLYLFANRSNSFNLMGTFLKRYAIDASSDEDFLRRVKESMAIFMNANPELKPAFPEIIFGQDI